MGIKQNISKWPTYSPIYPRVNGRTLSVQGDKLVTSPAPKITAKLMNRENIRKKDIRAKRRKRKKVVPTGN
jgi:hypothetical protein